MVSVMPDSSIQDAIKTWFGIRNRDFYFCQAAEPFTMPGLEIVHPTRFSEGTPNRKVRKGQGLIVRIDSRTPERIDVALIIRNEEDRNFLLNGPEYDFLRDKVEVVD